MSSDSTIISENNKDIVLTRLSEGIVLSGTSDDILLQKDAENLNVIIKNENSSILVSKEQIVRIPTGVAGVQTKNPGVTFGNGFDAASLITNQFAFIKIPYSGIIKGWYIYSIGDCSCEIDVRKKFNAYPAGADSIVGSQKPSLANSSSAEDVVLTGWNTVITKNDIIGFVVSSLSGGPKQITLILNVETT